MGVGVAICDASAPLSRAQEAIAAARTTIAAVGRRRREKFHVI
jgi:hypothetical protein